MKWGLGDLDFYKSSPGIRLVLFLTLLLATTLAVLLPINGNMVAPDFSASVLIGYEPELVSFLIFVFAIVLYFALMNPTPVNGLVVCLAFSMFFMGTWISKAPGGTVLLSGASYGSYTNEVVTSGHTSYAFWEIYPSLFLYSGALKISTGLSMLDTIGVLSSLRIIFYVLPVYLIALRFLPVRAGTVATIISIVGDSELIRNPPFNIETFGFITFMFFALLLFRQKSLHSGGAISVVLACVACVLSYPLAGAIVAAIAAYMTWHRVVNKPSGIFPVSMLILLVILVAVWNAFYSVSITNWLVLVYHNILVLLGHSSIQTGHSAGPSSTLFLLLSADGSNAANFGYLLFVWFFLLDVLGLLYFLKELRKNKTSMKFAVIPLLVVGVVLLLLPGGAEWTRILPFIDPLLAVFVVTHLRLARGKQLIALAVIVAVSLPTLVSYSPAIGTQYSQYSWEFSTGTFVGKFSAPTGGIIDASGIVAVNQSIIVRLAYVPVGGFSDYQSFLKSLNLTLISFNASPQSELFVNSVLTSSIAAHLYDVHPGSGLSTDLETRLSTHDLAYTNGFSSIYAN